MRWYLFLIAGLYLCTSCNIQTEKIAQNKRQIVPVSFIDAIIHVMATQLEFEKVIGYIFGFYCPEYAKGINVPGLHLHFLNNARTSGGHILGFNLKSGTMEIGYLLDYRLILPTGGDFYGGDFTVDRTDDLKNAEN